MVKVDNKVCLIVHDGWGVSEIEKGNAIAGGDTTNMDTIAKNHSYRTLQAHGLAVGLSDGLMGNSEKREFHKNKTILESCQHAKDTSGRLHLLGLVSDGGVHSHIHHLKALLETAKEVGVPKAIVHFVGDGRDTAPRSSSKYLKELLEFMQKEQYGEIGTVVGRYYAMDRDKRWERVKIAIDGLVSGEGENSSDPVATIEERYKKDETDEFLKPIIVGGEETRIKGKCFSKGARSQLIPLTDNDTIFFFNYRSDRMREIVSVFGLPDKPMEVTVPKDLHITTMSRYNSEFPFNIAFPPQAMTNVLAEWLAKKGLKQSHIAETEKYAHVTFFFNGGVEKQFDQEDRELIPSPKVATYDKQPEMSAQGVADKVAETVAGGKYDFVMCNFAPPDMVGHTGVYDAAVQAITATDKAVKTVYDACQKAGYILAITADHGNAEQMINPETGNPHTAHTTNPVPFIITGDSSKYGLAGDEENGEDEEGKGALADVAPTILDLMGLDKPEGK
ncbi:unnamed protein product [Rhizoctonia solani]|uniref:phosphoglycerate mutase (2,3-diphosphoglycerate-independent) n=1 Tax=Rhizoctonia solani TaxID=456999 RepID=A0A8H2Y108_9AGAM|nr:unnamed protein product [Rhizoctonia solani]